MSTTTPSPKLTAAERRQRVQRMMNEDVIPVASTSSPSFSPRKSSAMTGKPYADAQWSPKKKSTPTTPASPRRTKATTAAHSASPSTTPRLALKFNGLVYRTLDSTVPGVAYSTEGDLFGQPDERVGEMERDRRDEKRRALEREMLIARSTKDRTNTTPMSTPTKQRQPPIESNPAPLPYISSELDQSSRTTTTLGLPFTSTKSTTSASILSSIINTLSPASQSLFALYTALEYVLLLHLSGEGSAVASSTSSPVNPNGEKTIRIPKLIDYVKLRNLIESGGRQFHEKDLARLVWIWEGCGCEEESMESIESDGEDELYVGVEGERLQKDRGGLGFTISTTRIIGSQNKIILTYALGITLTIRNNPHLPLYSLIPASPSRLLHSPSRSLDLSSPGRQRVVIGGSLARSPAAASSSSAPTGREGMSTVALWSQGSEARRIQVATRLQAWETKCRMKGISSVVPMATLPLLYPAVRAISGTTSPSKKRKHDEVEEGILVANGKGEIEVLVPVAKKQKVAGPKLSATKQRAKDLMDRIQAKQNANQPSAAYIANFTALNAGEVSSGKSLKHSSAAAKAYASERSEGFRYRSLLSRMGAIADGVWMLFSMSNQFKRPIPLEDVATSIVKSSKIALSLDEALDALNLLVATCPEFVHIKTVDRQEWMFMKGEIGPSEVRLRFVEKLKESKAV